MRGILLPALPTKPATGHRLTAKIRLTDRARVDQRLFNPQSFELSMQRRALHPDEFGSSRDISAKSADLGYQIVALKGLARLAQRESKKFLAPDAARYGRH